MYYVYAIQNLINLKIYIGQTSDYQRRWRSHRNAVETIIKTGDWKKGLAINRAIAKYGIENFSFQILESFLIEDELMEAESF